MISIKLKKKLNKQMKANLKSQFFKHKNKNLKKCRQKCFTRGQNIQNINWKQKKNMFKKNTIGIALIDC